MQQAFELRRGPVLHRRQQVGVSVERHGDLAVAEAFQLPLALIEALTAFVDQHKPETTKSAVMRLALEQFLERQGFWPATGKRREK